MDTQRRIVAMHRFGAWVEVIGQKELSFIPFSHSYYLGHDIKTERLSSSAVEQPPLDRPVEGSTPS